MPVDDGVRDFQAKHLTAEVEPYTPVAGLDFADGRHRRLSSGVAK
jgi:hypothetical protein